MKKINEVNKKVFRNVRLIQFGEGNFLRGFADLMIDISNRKGITDIGVAVIKPVTFGSLDAFREQDGMYSVLLRGKQEGQVLENTYVVDCIQSYYDSGDDYEKYSALASLPELKFVISNTTEAGIVFDERDDFSLCPPNSYPGKLTKFLFERFKTFNGDAEKGLIILPVELIEDNGKVLKDCILRLSDLWGLPDEFKSWLNNANKFCCTLVDRIITGYPKNESDRLCQKFGYEDKLIVTGEPFGLWVIECDESELLQKELPLDKAGQNVIFTTCLKPYRERKVRILNGAHTGTIMAAYLAGLDTVAQCANHETVRKYMEKLVYDEIAPTVPLPKEEANAFADAVMERFENPFIRHELMSIALNSVSKWKTRILPSLIDSYNANGAIPKCLTFSFAALLAFYTSDKLTENGLECNRSNETYTILDDREALEFFAENSKRPEYVRLAASNTAFWGTDLSKLDGFCQMVEEYLRSIRDEGSMTAMEKVMLD